MRYPYNIIYHRTSSNDIIYSDRKYLDPFWKDPYFVGTKIARKYFLDNYGLSYQEVWNLLHGFPKDQIHYCKYCNGALGFRSLVKGFGELCSMSCTASYAWTLEDYRSNKIAQLKSLWRDPDYAKRFTEGRESIESKNLMQRSSFITRAKGRDSYFYLAKDEFFSSGWVKFGITTNIHNRSRWSGYSRTFVLLKGSPERIAQIEYELKLFYKEEYFRFEEFKQFKIKFRNAREI